MLVRAKFSLPTALFVYWFFYSISQEVGCSNRCEKASGACQCRPDSFTGDRCDILILIDDDGDSDDNEIVAVPDDHLGSGSGCQTTNEKQPVNQLCNTTLCPCCLDTVTCPPDGQCGGQCKDGYFGGKCLNTCPDNCISCEDPYNPTGTSSLWGVANCTQCKDGYYSTSQLFQCQFDCPNACQTCNINSECTSCKDGYTLVGTTCRQCKTGCAFCTSNDNCTECDDGYYNSDGDVNNLKCVICSRGCSNRCEKASGACHCRPDSFTGDRCDVCINGMTGENCNISCQTGCAKCTRTSRSDCTSCIHGYYLQGNTCPQCKPGCAQCNSFNDCTLCLHGYYNSGSDCVTCSNGCANVCDKGTGECTCKSGFDGEKCDKCSINFRGTDCDQCIQGNHGTSCGQSCPQNCKLNECRRYIGTCTNGCVEHFTGDSCNDCITGRYEQNCTGQCPGNCDGACDRSSGHCQLCKTNFAGNTCDECNVGKHGPNCSLDCSPGCGNNKCGRGTGKCDSCQDGMYGGQCNIPCPPNCSNKTCEQNTGACIGNCTSGYSGDMCCLHGSNCKSCFSASQCSECLPGSYGETCDDECPSNCADNICDKNNGTCNGCKDGYTGNVCDITNEVKGGDDEISGATIGGGVAGGVVLMIIVGGLLFFFMRRRASGKDTNTANGTAAQSSEERVYENGPTLRSETKNQKGKESAIRNDKIASSKRKEMWPPQPVKPSSKKEQPLAGSLIPDVQSEDETMPENDYYNSGDVAQKGIPITELTAYIDQKDAAFFESEFTRLPQGLIKPTEEAMKEHNLGKNRYNAIYPYDETRVTLQGPGSDFINACYIEGFRKRREYIASLGPIAKATEGYQTFWRMVWQEKTEKIVMVTNLMENGGMKCEKYWPDVNKFKQYGDVTVACHSQDAYAEYTVRSFTVKKGKEKQRSLHHIHYTAWPDKGVPDDVTSLIEFRNKVNSTKVKLGGPVIVHCSAGVGRTGTYIALDILTYKGEKTGYVDIFDCVEKLRQQRTIMVQTAGQYEYVHRALAHTLTLGSEAIPADKFQNYASSIPDTMFDKLSHCKEKVSNEDKEAFVTNKALTHLNRKGADIPGDSNRPRLYLGRTTEENNYINAVYVNSFKVKNKFIMTQTPLPTTVNDFLTLVVQENCSCIVSMDPPGLSDKSIGTYLPADNQELCVEPFQLKTIKVVSEGSFTQRTLTITSTLMGSTTNRTVQHFQYTRWPGGSNAPAASGEFLQLVKEVQKASDEAPTSSAVIVHCRTGSERSGLLCVVVSLLQKMEIEHEVSVINTVRQVKFRRPKAIPNKEQFTFCHTCVASYLKTFDIYSNFS